MDTKPSHRVQLGAFPYLLGHAGDTRPHWGFTSSLFYNDLDILPFDISLSNFDVWYFCISSIYRVERKICSDLESIWRTHICNCARLFILSVCTCLEVCNEIRHVHSEQTCCSGRRKRLKWSNGTGKPDQSSPPRESSGHTSRRSAPHALNQFCDFRRNCWLMVRFSISIREKVAEKSQNEQNMTS